MLSTVQRVLARVQRSPVTKRAYSVEASDKIDAFVQRFNASKYAQELSGYSLSVVRLDNKGSSVVKHYTYGSADVEKKVPVTETTSFRIGSISKTMTALLVMKLIEEGKLPGLDCAVQDYLTSIKMKGIYAPYITVRHLLTHTSGIDVLLRLGHIFYPLKTIGIPVGQPIPKVKDLYPDNVLHLKNDVRPGKYWTYANHGYGILGQLIEDVSGMSLEAYAQKTLFQPLGMNDTSFHRTDAVKAALAVGYESRKKVAEDLEIILPAAGSVFSTPNDMVKYVESLLCAYNNHKDHPLALSFRHNILDEMWSPQFSQDKKNAVSMGLGFILDPNVSFGPSNPKLRYVGHNGGWPGFSSAMSIFPDLNLGVIALCNQSDAADILENAIIFTVLQSLGAQTSVLPPESTDARSLPHNRIVSNLTTANGGYLLDTPSWVDRISSWMSVGRKIRLKIEMDDLDGNYRASINTWSWWGHMAKVTKTEIEIKEGQDPIVYYWIGNNPLPQKLVIHLNPGGTAHISIGLHIYRHVDNWWDFIALMLV